MTTKEALYWCEQFTDNIVLADPQKEKMVLALQAMEKCKEALEKQMPKKVTHEVALHKCCTCPNCKNVVDEFTDFAGKKTRVMYNHCRICGQALDWSDEE